VRDKNKELIGVGITYASSCTLQLHVGSLLRKD
jgi:hypothetical protein